MIAGRATVEGTAGYFNSRRELGGWLEGAGLHCSLIGFGSYRVDDVTPSHSEALKTALLSGCNLIDTSTNYTDGGSERMIGKALEEMIRVGVIDRNQIIVVSKIGYVQGQALELAREREKSGSPFPDMVKYQDDCWHCIHPDFLADQLDRSMQRLGVECLDFCLLHNPEYFLMAASKTDGSKSLDKMRTEFYSRIQKAFEFLDTQVAKGRLQGYGVSSNTVGAPASRADATSLSRFWDAAQAIGEHHFRIVQLPMNLYETGPYFEKNTGSKNEQTALEFAAKNDIAVLVNRPLNAFTRLHMVRLADFPQDPNAGSIDKHLETLAALENEYRQKIAPTIKTGEGGPPAADLFRWSYDLGQVKEVKLGADKWSQIEDQISGHVGYLCEQISQQVQQGPWKEWQDRYLPTLKSALIALRNEANARSQKPSAEVAKKVDPLLPEPWQSKTLSQKALGIVMHTPAVSCVLNGMRRPDYVHDSMSAIPLPRLPEEAIDKIYKAFKA